jgi:hypothetical protein
MVSDSITGSSARATPTLRTKIDASSIELSFAGAFVVMTGTGLVAALS